MLPIIQEDAGFGSHPRPHRRGVPAGLNNPNYYY